MTDYPADTMWGLLARGAETAAAIAAPSSDKESRPPLTHGALRSLATDTVAALNAMGIGRGDRVGMVLPNGPEMAAAFIAVAEASTV